MPDKTTFAIYASGMDSMAGVREQGGRGQCVVASSCHLSPLLHDVKERLYVLVLVGEKQGFDGKLSIRK